jgi:hypothetical protein
MDRIMRGREPKLTTDCDALTAMRETPADHLTVEGRYQHLREVKEIGWRRGLELRAEGNETA